MATKTKTIKIAKGTTKKTAKAAKAKATKPAAGNKPLSQMAAAARVLGQAGEPMNCNAMVEAMTKKGLWSSPAGKTPAATLYAALLRHIREKGKEAEFKKVGPGQFALNR